jgi:hypothetical protein
VKLCKKCHRPVDYSVCTVVSTNRISPRFQKCSKSIALCQGCFDSFLIAGDGVISESIRTSIRPALSAPKGTRRITCARAIKLFPKFNSGISWELLRSSIYHMLAECRMRDFKFQASLGEFISIELDEEKFLKAFQLHNVWADKPKDEMDDNSKQNDAIRLYPESAFNQRRRMCR